MASAVKSILSSPTIQVSTGGGADLTDSVAPSNFRCQWVDIVSLNAQYFNEYYIMDQLTIAKTLSSQYDKPLVLNVFGALSVRPKFFSRVMKFCQSINMSWIMWAFVKPGDNRNRMEFYNQDSHTMQVISSRALEIWTNASSTNWIEYELPHGLAPNTIIDWKNCEDSYQCLYTIEKTSCCTNIYSSSDGVAKW